MRKRFTLLFVAGFVLGGFGLWPAGAYDASLCGWWPLDDGAGTVLNLGSSEAIQMAEVASIINRLTSSSSRIFEGPEPASERPFYGLVPDITSAKELLGWTPRTKLEDGLRETIERCPFNL